MLNRDKYYEAIVIGTSAGGLHALTVILEGIPSDYRIPIVVVQHRSKDTGDLLEEVLQSKCKIKVKQADEKEHLAGGIVYVAPPNYHLMIETDKTFSLSSGSQIHFSRPSIDALFESAALVYGEKLVGIILTGANDDGATGISAIDERGGLTIAQNPDEAQFPFMPLASIETKRVRHIWSLSTIGNYLLKL